MLKNITFSTLLILLLLILMDNSFAQQPQAYNERDDQLLLINQMIDNSNYLSAQSLINKLNIQNSDLLTESYLDYYEAMISLISGSREGPGLAKKFEYKHSQFSKLDKLKLEKGNYYFKKKKYKNAAAEYEQVNPKYLDRIDKNTYYFKIAYSYFENGKMDPAKKMFYKVKDTDSDYAASATYYYSHINYDQQNFATALKGFNTLTGHPTFKSIVPYYISQIYYQEGNYDKLLETAPDLFKEAKGQRKNEIAKLVGDAYFKLSEFDNSIGYLDYYRLNSQSGYTRSDYYQLAYANMMTEDYENAIKYFEKVRNKDDALSQNALYNLANCYLQTNQKEFAGKAYYAAYELDFDQQIKEDALFNFAKISYELGNDPYNRAINAINTYINNYPDSPRKNEAYTYLVNLFLSSKNYKGALISLESIAVKNNDLNRAYQKIAFKRGVELYNEKQFSNALTLFEKSMELSYDQDTELESKYWAADCNYHLRKYYDAIVYFKEIASDYSIKNFDFAQNIDYNIAFCYYMLSNYSEASNYFYKVANNSIAPPKIIADAYLRNGDCHYIMKDFSNAVKLYDKAFEMNQANADYAMYQGALAYGGMGNLNKKLEDLNVFIKSFPRSGLADDAFFELGTTYLIFEKNNEAIKAFNRLLKRFPNTPFKKQALLKIGLTYYNIDENDQALDILKQVVQNYSGTKESNEALVSIRNIYVESNRAEDFFVYVKNIPFASISDNEQDSISYMATENVYMNGDCENALIGFDKYIDQFPRGVFSINAHFYRAECLMKENEMDLALEDYQFVLNNSRAAFRESSLLKSARIYRVKKQFYKALKNYKELFQIASNEIYISESLDGQLECFHQLGQSDSVLVVGKTILTSNIVPESTQKKAHAYMANAALKIGDLELANKEYTIVSKLMKGETAAEAKYQQAYIQFKLKNYKESEKIVFALINEFGSYDLWVTKGFILLADIYVKYDNTFQAKQTLQSVIDHQEDTSLVNLAKHKKKIIEELEAIEERANEAALEEDSIKFEE
jgi:TolA-binding protein